MRILKKSKSRLRHLISNLFNTFNITSFWLLGPLFFLSILIGFITAVIDAEMEAESESLTSLSITTKNQDQVEALTGDTLDISSKVSGKVIGVYVKDNQLVKKGTLLFVIDPIPYKIALNEARSALQLAHKQLHLISADKSVNKDEVKIIDEKIKSLKDTVKSAEYNLSHSAIYAPFDGRVVNFDLEPGEFVDAGIEIFTLVDLRNKFLLVKFLNPLKLVEVF